MDNAKNLQTDKIEDDRSYNCPQTLNYSKGGLKIDVKSKDEQ